jgi:hypothetical protein
MSGSESNVREGRIVVVRVLDSHTGTIEMFLQYPGQVCKRMYRLVKKPVKTQRLLLQEGCLNGYFHAKVLATAEAEASTRGSS